MSAVRKCYNADCENNDMGGYCECDEITIDENGCCVSCLIVPKKKRKREQQMNKEKQIEEMANEIYETLMLEAECPLSGMDCSIIADLLVNKGYRKASDVAREIFEEIDKQIAFFTKYMHTNYSVKVIVGVLEILKKKYTEEGNESHSM